MLVNMHVSEHDMLFSDEPTLILTTKLKKNGYLIALFHKETNSMVIK